MKRFARMLFAGIAIVAAGSAISLVPHKTANAGNGAPVNIVNPSLAVTQSGPWNVGITGTPTVNIGTPTVNLGAGSTVGISGTPTVNAAVTFPANQQVAVTNTQSAPVPTRDVDYPARHSFQQSCGGNADSFGQALCSIGPIPPTTEFVIQTLSTGGNGTIPIGGVQVGTNNGTTQASIQVPVIQQTPNFWSATQAVTLYAGPNAVPSCNAQTSVGGFVSCTFVGYLVSLP